MTLMGWIQIGFLFLVLLFLIKPIGSYIYYVFESPSRHSLLGKIEDTIFLFCGIKKGDQDWKDYTLALLIFNGMGIFILFMIQSLQHVLPLNPQSLPSVPWDLALNTAVSFTTNTNWQAYSGETTMSYLTQMSGLTWQNFCSAATGMAVFLAFARGMTQSAAPNGKDKLGNFWVDLIRSLLYLFLPACFIFALVLISQGVIQNFLPSITLITLEGIPQTLSMGPVATQEAIKILGTNGGGFFNASSSHPFENPTPLTNFLQILGLVMIPAALTYTYGKMAKNSQHGWSLLSVMIILSLLSTFLIYHFESQTNPLLQTFPLEQELGNMEGKEVRFGGPNSALFASLTTSVAGGAVNAMHDSFTPLGGLVTLINMLLGEVVFGSVGLGLLSMVFYVFITVFIAGLMIGRTPEYLGKKIEGKDIRFVVLFIALHSILVLLGTASSLVTTSGIGAIGNSGPHGLSEILYAFASTAQNNGSAFSGLQANNLWYNLILSVVMLLGRYLSICLALAMAGSMVSKKRVIAGLGTLPTQGPLFIGLLIGIILIVGALTFFPILALGPFLENSYYLHGKVF